MKNLVLTMALVGGVTAGLVDFAHGDDAGTEASLNSNDTPATVVAPAPTPPQAEDPIGLVKQLHEAVLTKAWGKAVLLALLLLVGLLRWFSTKFSLLEWFTTSKGGWVLNFSSAVFGYLLTMVLAGAGFSLNGLLMAFMFALSGAGAIEFFKDFKPTKPKAESK